MTNIISWPAADRTRARKRTRAVLALACTAAAGIALLATAGAALANDEFCDGFTRLDPRSPEENTVLYRFRCTDAIAGYSIVSHDEMAMFSSEGEVQNPLTGVALNGESYSCEGPIPGHGEVCNGKASLGNVVQATVGTSTLPCSSSSSFYLTVADAKGAPAGVFDLGRPRGCPHALAVRRRASRDRRRQQDRLRKARHAHR